MKRPPIDPDLLRRYLNGTASLQERATVDAWYAALPGPPDHLSTLPATEQRALQEATLRTIRAKLNLPLTDPPVVPLRWNRPPWVRVGGAVAACLLLVFAWFALRRTDRLIAPPLAQASRVIRFVNEQPRLVSQRLSDGTVIWLHPRAELTYPTQFAAHRRDVQFSGEGFFDVAKDTHRPFFIRSGAMQIRVVGTSFNVRAAPQRAIYEVAVVTGKVIVQSLNKASSGAAAAVVLLPRQEALFDVTGNRLSRHAVARKPRREIYEPVTLSFADTPVDEVIRQLEDRFKVQIRVTNPAVNTCRLTADFADQPLPVILELLCTSLDASYAITGETIILNSEGCN